MNSIDIQEVNYGSEFQRKSIELRYKLLREPLGLAYTAEQLAEEAEETHIVAIRHGQVVGVVVLKRVGKTIIKMRQVAVEPSCQGKGIGRQMVLFSERYAVQHGYNLMELHARETAVDFYLSLNYHISGDLFMEVGIPHYKMSKQL